MAKSKKKTKKSKAPKEAAPATPKSGLLEKLEQPRYIIVFFFIFFIFLLFFYKPLVFDGLEGSGGDVLSGIGKTHQLKADMEETGKRALWNPYMFAGMPIYHRINAVVWSVDTVISKLDGLIDWRVWYLWLGALGMFLLAKYLGLSAIGGIVAGICFILIPHLHAMNVVGHFSKFRALMWVPFVLLTFLLLLNKRNLLSMFLFALAFALSLRTQHYQIVFYTVLLLFFFGIVPFVKLVLQNRWNDFLRFTGLFIISLALVLLLVAQPLFVTGDYTPYSTRGGSAISLQESTSEQDKKGVGFDYATNWSFSLAEFWDLIVPKFHGGLSQEVYRGKSVPQLKNQAIPAYWGEMPFTQSYEYMGVILVFLALIGILFRWRRPEVKYLTFLTALALLLSLGRNFSILYKLFFYYFPYFDKFRVPMMILNLVVFNVAILAAFGLDFLLSKDFQRKETQRNFYKFAGVFLVLLIVPLLFGSSFSLSPPDELQRYAGQYGPDQGQQVVNLLRDARLDILKSSALRTVFFFLIGTVMFVGIMRQWARKDLLAAGIVLLTAADLGFVSTGYLEGRFSDIKKSEAQTYRENAADKVIKQDKSLYRVLPPLQNLARDTRWSYHHQSIGGYSPAKLQLIQDIISNNLVSRSPGNLPFNLPVVSMLNGKYIAANQRYDHPQLEFLGEWPQENLFLYRNRAVLPRAFFVDNSQVIEDGVKRLAFMNSADFDPATTALLEKPITEQIGAPDSSSAEITLFEPDQVIVDAYTDKTALLVLSELFYPKGWRAVLENGDELTIYKTNHLLRSVVVPEGNHTITFQFRPRTYYMGIRLTLVGSLIVYAGILFLIYRSYGQKIRGRLKSPSR